MRMTAAATHAVVVVAWGNDRRTRRHWRHVVHGSHQVRPAARRRCGLATPRASRRSARCPFGYARSFSGACRLSGLGVGGWREEANVAARAHVHTSTRTHASPAHRLQAHQPAGPMTVGRRAGRWPSGSAASCSMEASGPSLPQMTGRMARKGEGGSSGFWRRRGSLLRDWLRDPPAASTRMRSSRPRPRARLVRPCWRAGVAWGGACVRSPSRVVATARRRNGAPTAAGGGGRVCT